MGMHGNHVIHLCHYCSNTSKAVAGKFTTTFRAEPITSKKSQNDLPSDSASSDSNQG